METDLEVPAETCTKWARELKKRVSDTKGQDYFFWTALGPFCAMQFIDDLQYLERASEETKSREVGARKPNVQLKTLKTTSREGFRKRELVQVVAINKLRLSKCAL